MEILHIEARKKFGKINWKALDELNLEQVSLAASIQYLDLLDEVKNYLEGKGVNVIIKKGAFHDGQVLGCNANAFDSDAKSLLLLCDGKFHATNNAIRLNREILIFNGEEVTKFDEKEMEKIKSKIKGKQMKFLSSKTIGLLVSTKIGQESKAYLKIAEKIEKINKNVYIFLTDNIDVREFDNFNYIDFWVNTACFGLGLDSLGVINLQDILEFI
jgi:diphthamide biosynthesis enzyme Dph1/Dph2-like protein